MNYIKCNDCGSQSFKVAIDRFSERLIIDCNCNHRFSLPAITNEKDIRKFSGNINETGDKVKP